MAPIGGLYCGTYAHVTSVSNAADNTPITYTCGCCDHTYHTIANVGQYHEPILKRKPIQENLRINLPLLKSVSGKSWKSYPKRTNARVRS